MTPSRPRPRKSLGHLQRSPIVEAIFDFRVEPSSHFNVESFRTLGEPLDSHLPNVREVGSVEAQFELVPGGRTQTEAKPIELFGIMRSSADGKNIAQFRQDGFTFNRLRPYTSWDELRPTVLELWGLYSSRAQPSRCFRIGVRNINRLDVQSPANLRGLFSYPPAAHRDLGTRLDSFLTRIAVENPKNHVQTMITQASQDAPDPATLSMILDIDSFRTSSSGISMEPKDVERLLEELRESKNLAFRRSLKPDFLLRYS